MEALEYTTFDKSDWGAGPWQHEPDKVQWADAATGLPCLIVRNNAGALCGYVGVPPGHRYFGVRFHAVAVEAHGGLSYSDHCQAEGDESQRICHIPGEGEPDHIWWLGFDCSHCSDYLPALDLWNTLPCPWAPSGHIEYRDLQYVKKVVTQLAQQLAQVSSVSLHAE